MPNLYGVTPADVAAELPGLFRGGFSASTKPTNSAVQELLDAADLIAQLEVAEATGAVPDAAANAAVLARKYIKEQTKAEILRIVYAGNDPKDVDAAATPYETRAEMYRAAIERLGTQGSQTTPQPIERTRGSMPTRQLYVADEDLDGSGWNRRRF